MLYFSFMHLLSYKFNHISDISLYFSAVFNDSWRVKYIKLLTICCRLLSDQQFVLPPQFSDKTEAEVMNRFSHLTERGIDQYFNADLHSELQVSHEQHISTSLLLLSPSAQTLRILPALFPAIFFSFLSFSLVSLQGQKTMRNRF